MLICVRISWERLGEVAITPSIGYGPRNGEILGQVLRCAPMASRTAQDLTQHPIGCLSRPEVTALDTLQSAAYCAYAS